MSGLLQAIQVKLLTNKPNGGYFYKNCDSPLCNRRRPEAGGGRKPIKPRLHVIMSLAVQDVIGCLPHPNAP